MRSATHGHGYLDMCAFCSANTVHKELEAFGEQGRLLQALLIGSIDLLIPLLSCAFGLSLLLLLTRHVKPRWVAMVVSLPIVAMLLEFAETSCIMGSLLVYPASNQALSSALSSTLNEMRSSSTSTHRRRYSKIAGGQ